MKVILFSSNFTLAFNIQLLTGLSFVHDFFLNNFFNYSHQYKNKQNIKKYRITNVPLNDFILFSLVEVILTELHITP